MPRLGDIVVATVALVVSLPLLAVAAVAIKLGSTGPVLYRQLRVGRDGAEFELFKLRTMVAGSDPVGIGTAVGSEDPRVTRAGRTLRRFSLDELPNLLNVLRGEMAIVGPRPTIPAQVELYTPEQRRRLEAKPGLTGWAQVNGRGAVDWEERIALDVWYVDNRSFGLDIRILLKTVWLLVSGQGISPGEAQLKVPDAWQRDGDVDSAPDA